MSEQREELLKRWAELAQGECEVWREAAPYLLPEFRFVALGAVVDMGDYHDRAVLLLALIEAVRARGWHYRLRSDETETENEEPCAWHDARVFYSKTYPTQGLDASAAEPCDALLSAYVQALKATQENGQ